MDSNLQIISGAYRGRKLKLPIDARPTQNLARGAIFNMLTDILADNQDIRAWDAFAGSGALGIEVLSRFSTSMVMFTDIANNSVKTVKNNIVGLNVDVKRYKIMQMDALTIVDKYAHDINLVFVDPPYIDANIGIKFVQKLGPHVQSGTVVVQEIESNVNYVPNDKIWEILRDKKYGRARFLILRKI